MDDENFTKIKRNWQKKYEEWQNNTKIDKTWRKLTKKWEKMTNDI